MNTGSILVLSEWFAPGFKAGGPIKSSRLLVENLCDDFDFFVLTRNSDYLDQNVYDNVSPDKWFQRDDHTYQTYYSSRMGVFPLLARIKEVSPEIIYINGLFSFWFSVLPILFRVIGLIRGKLIVTPHGMLQSGALRFKGLKKRSYLYLLKYIGVEKRAIFHVTDDQEKADVIKYFPNAEIHLIRHFIENEAAPKTIASKEKGEVRLVYISRIAAKKNLRFLIKLLHNQSEKIHLTVVGPVDETGYWQKCQSDIRQLQSNISVEYIGPKKPSELNYLFQSHHFFVLPTLGENFGYAILEAWSNGLPVLISDNTPWRSLQEKLLGWDLDLNDSRLWSKAIMELVEMDDMNYQKMRSVVLGFIGSEFNLDDIRRQYISLFGCLMDADSE